jgi:hypothetical protein
MASELFRHLLIQDGIRAVKTEGVPSDIEINLIHHDPFKDEFIIRVESKEFPEVPPGKNLEELQVTVSLNDVRSVLGKIYDLTSEDNMMLRLETLRKIRELAEAEYNRLTPDAGLHLPTFPDRVTPSPADPNVTYHGFTESEILHGTGESVPRGVIVERKAGRSKLVYDKTKRTIVAESNTASTGKQVPNLINAPDEEHRCCVLDDHGNRCPNKTVFWVGTNGVDDYTYCCTDHLDAVKRAGDTVRPKHS